MEEKMIQQDVPRDGSYLFWAVMIGMMGLMLLRLQQSFASQQEAMKEMTAKFSGLLLQLTETREALSQTQGELSQTQSRLSGTEHKLSQTQGELSQTQGELSQTQQELKSLKEKSSGFFSAYDRSLAQEAKEAKEAKVRELQPQVPGLLSLVASGEQAKAEELIARDPEILLQAGDITDGAGRYFKCITALQYAVWALDAHMWTMILPYFEGVLGGLNARASAVEQLRALEEKGTVHGRHFDFKPLLDAYAVYLRSPSADTWCRGVGGEQRLLPDHVVQEYTTPDRSFDPTPSFAVADARRPTAHRARGVSWWRSAEYNNGTMGVSWVGLRAEMNRVTQTHCRWDKDLPHERIALPVRTRCRERQGGHRGPM